MRKEAKITIRVTKDLKDNLEQFAADDSRSLSSYIEIHLERLVEFEKIQILKNKK